MMAFFLIVMGVPLLIAAASFVFLKGITLKEFGLIALAQLVVAGCSAGIVSCANTADVEVWNGRVTSKAKVPVPCSHSYSCNCHEVCSGSGKNRSCTTECDTCYKHYAYLRTIQGNDYDWDVYTSNAETVTINRIDEQGVHAPPRWTAVKVGDPTSLTHSYTNYVKGAPDTLFRHQGLKQKYAASIPTYPQGVYDYYRLDRLVSVGVGVEDPRSWNVALTELNADLGRSKQANMIVVLVKNMPDDYFYALEESWVGGKKNDVVLVVSVDDQMKPQWASVLCWTTNELFKVKLRDDVMNDPVINREAILEDLRVNVSKYFERKPMKDFEYLSSSILPTSTQWVITLLIGIFVAGILIFVFQQNDTFGDERGRFRPDVTVTSLGTSIKKRFRNIFTSRPWEDA
jgi:hypothetical protein